MYMSGEYDKSEETEDDVSVNVSFNNISGPRIVGTDPRIKKRCTCYNCGSVIEYLPKHIRDTCRKDEGEIIRGLDCPGCGNFIRTNP